MRVPATAFFFFFSSRRRHTRFDCDWSSDVCSSDLWVGYRIAGAYYARAKDKRAAVHELDRKSTRLNSSHSQISYAVFCLKKKNNNPTAPLSPAPSSEAHFRLLDGRAVHS